MELNSKSFNISVLGSGALFCVDSSLIPISVILNSRFCDLRAVSGRNSLVFAIPNIDESLNAASEQFCRLNHSSCSRNVPGKKSGAFPPATW